MPVRKREKIQEVLPVSTMVPGKDEKMDYYLRHYKYFGVAG